MIIPHRQLVGFQRYVDKRVQEGVRNGVKLFLEIREQGYSGSYATINRYLKNTRQNSKQYKKSIRFETEPGKQAQVDWGHFGKIEINGKIERLYCFVYILGYSRTMYIEFTIKQNLQTLEDCHIHAFEKLGIPKEIVYDNMKTVVLYREKLPDGRRKIFFNPGFLDFASHYNFEVNPTAPYWPRAKGKVEAGVKYVRNNFMQGLRFKKEFRSLTELNEQAYEWIKNIANQRIHATLGEKPTERWLKERGFLRFPQDYPRYKTAILTIRKSTKDGFVQYRWNFYEIPQKYAGKNIAVKEISDRGVSKLEMYIEGVLIWTHLVENAKGKWITIKQTVSKKNKKRLTQGRNKDLPKLHFGRPLSYYDELLLGDAYEQIKS